jgi:hypothetical protein
MILEEKDLDDIPSICPLNPGDKVKYNYEGRIGFSGTVEEVSCVWIVTVKNHHGTTQVAPASHWEEKQ